MQHHSHLLPDGKRLHYISWGQPSAPAVVCVHGLTRNARDFDALAARLADDFYVICVDVIGRGQSDWADSVQDYTVLHYAQQMLHLLDTLNIASPHWVGTSMGGLIAMTLQAIAPDRFQKLVLNDVGPVIELVALERIAKYIGAAPVFDSRAQAVAYAKQVFVGFGAKNDQEWAGLTDHYYIDLPNGQVKMHYDPKISEATKAAVAGMTPESLASGEAVLWASLKSLQHPCLVLRGESSDLLSVATVAAMQQANSKLSAVTIPACGHAPHLLDQEQIQIVRNFLL